MKKLYFLTAIVAVMFAINANAQKKLAYITTVPIATTGATANDTLFVKAFQAAGFTVDLINAGAALPALSGYDVLVLSAVPGSNADNNSLKALRDSSFNKPFVNMKSFQLQSSRWNWGTPKNSQGTGSNVWAANGADTLVTVVPSQWNHPIFNGIQFQDEIALCRHAASTNAVVSFELLSSLTIDIIPLAYAGHTTLPSYFEIPIGQNINGSVTRYKQIVLGLSESSYATSTPAALALAVNAANYVLTPGNFVKQWQWERWSAATIANLTADTALTDRKWYAYEFNTDQSIKRFKNWGASVASLFANGIEVEETKDILFPTGLTGGSASNKTAGDLSLRVKWEGDGGIQLGSSNKTTTIKNLTAGQFVTLNIKSGNETAARGISGVSNMTGSTGESTYKTGVQGENIYTFEVTANGNVTFTYNGGIIVRSILVTQAPTATVDVANPTVAIAFNPSTKVKTVTITCETANAEIYYTIDGTNPTKASTRYTAPFELTAESFNIRSRAWVGESSSPGFGEKAWNDPFDLTKVYYIYSFGSDEGKNADNPKYWYAQSESALRWMEVTADQTLEENLGTIGLDYAKWILSIDENNNYTIKNKGNNKYALKTSIEYAGTKGTEDVTGTVASLGLGDAGEHFNIKKGGTFKDVQCYIFELSDTKVVEVNHNAVKDVTLSTTSLSNTMQVNNGIDDGTRSRFQWALQEAGVNTAINNPNYNKEISKTQYFDVMGRQVTEFTTNAVVIKKITYTDGTTASQKLLILK